MGDATEAGRKRGGRGELTRDEVLAVSRRGKDMPRNEKTSKRVATIAGRVLKQLAKTDYCGVKLHKVKALGNITLADLKALAASALTQRVKKPEG